jgi:tellurite resistance protein TehA-like permease
VFKATTELHLFFMMVLVIALKTDLASEKMFSVTFYDTTVFVLWMILVPGAFFFCVWSKIRSVVEDDIAEHHVKPNRKQSIIPICGPALGICAVLLT